jgi:hypothetical protein
MKIKRYLTESKNICKSGTILMIDVGEYSDYSVMGLFKVIKSFDPLEEKEKFLEENPDNKGRYNFNDDKYIGYLVRKQYIKDIAYSSLYMGSGATGNIQFYPFEK